MVTAMMFREAVAQGNVSDACPAVTVTASHYGEGDGYDKKRAANGAVFRKEGNTFAHKDLPFNTIVEFTNPDTGIVAIAVANDRGPFIQGRDVDLSSGLAEWLGFKRKGITTLVMRILSQPGLPNLCGREVNLHEKMVTTQGTELQEKRSSQRVVQTKGREQIRLEQRAILMKNRAQKTAERNADRLVKRESKTQPGRVPGSGQVRYPGRTTQI